MFVEFVYPLGFLAGIGVLVPVLIHLWRKQRRKVLRVGNARLFGEVKKSRINRLQLKNWPLLLVRCVLIAVLACLLAGPHVDFNRRNHREKGWVLLGHGYERSLGDAQRTLIDSLLQVGYGLRAFEAGFRSIDMQAGDTVGGVSDQFGLIHRLDEALPPGFPVVIFSRVRLAELHTDVPASVARLTWQAFAGPIEGASARWGVRAWKTKAGDIALLAAISDGQATRYERLVVQGDGREQGIEVGIDEGRVRLKLNGQPDWVVVEDGPLQVRFATERPQPDLDYLKAFFTAFEHTTGRPVAWASYQPGEECDWLFDFKDTTETDTTGAVAHVFRFVAGTPSVQAVNHLVQAGMRGDVGRAVVYRRMEGDYVGIPLWVDAYGNPLLTASRQDRYTLYQCYTRFDPQWTDLVWSAAFVDNMMTLLAYGGQSGLTGPGQPYPMDQRAYMGTLDLPHRIKTGQDICTRRDTGNAVPYLAWAALLVFAAERILTYRFPLRVQHG